MGVRQGCILSPTLFNLYINWLGDMIKENNEGIQLQPDNYILSILMYADDVVLFSDTIGGLQKQINTLQLFCEQSGMKVNLDKTKVLVFKNGGYLSKYERWYYEGKRIQCVSYYKYLGLTLSTRNIWSKSVEVISIQGSKTSGLIHNSLRRIGDASFQIYQKTFNTIILPILCYGAEIWGFKEYKSLEKVQIKFFKQFLGVNRNAPGLAVLGDCGRNKVFVHTVLKCIKYWLKLTRLPSDRCVKKCYNMLYAMDQRGKANWVTDIKRVLNHYGFSYVWQYQCVGDNSNFLKIIQTTY